jgi:hypothetical protein
MRNVAFAGLLMWLGACGGDEPAAGGMGDMPGMSAPAEDVAGDVTAEMNAHLDRMAAMPADSLTRILATHRQMVANMLAEMNREMRAMNMGADATWNATVDSLRTDLTTMPGMSRADLAGLFPAHRARVERLMSMHSAMMGAMRM